MTASTRLSRSIGPIDIQKAALHHVAVPMVEPFRISSGEVAKKEAVLVCLRSRSAEGWGESSAMPGGFYSAETPRGCRDELVSKVLPGVLGRRFANVGELETALIALTDNRFVRVAIETAAWEIVARERGVSVRQLMELPDQPVPSGLAVGLYDSPRELADALRRYDPFAYHRLKLKIKRGADIDVVAQGRACVGDFPMFVDANADYHVDEIPVFQQLDGFGLMMFEQPMGKQDLEGSALLQKNVHTPVCHDESAETAEGVLRAIELDACRIVNIKLQRVGGYLEALRIMEICQDHAIPAWIGTMPELGVGSAQALAIATHPACRFPTDVEPSLRWYTGDILREPIELQDRCLNVPSGPGIGYTVDPAAMERYSLWTHEASA